MASRVNLANKTGVGFPWKRGARGKYLPVRNLGAMQHPLQAFGRPAAILAGIRVGNSHRGARGKRELEWSKRSFPAFRPGQDAARIPHVFLFETELAREHRLLPTNGLA